MTNSTYDTRNYKDVSPQDLFKSGIGQAKSFDPSGYLTIEDEIRGAGYNFSPVSLAGRNQIGHFGKGNKWGDQFGGQTFQEALTAARASGDYTTPAKMLSGAEAGKRVSSGLLSKIAPLILGAAGAYLTGGLSGIGLAAPGSGTTAVGAGLPVGGGGSIGNALQAASTAGSTSGATGALSGLNAGDVVGSNASEATAYPYGSNPGTNLDPSLLANTSDITSMSDLIGIDALGTPSSLYTQAITPQTLSELSASGVLNASGGLSQTILSAAQQANIPVPPTGTDTGEVMDWVKSNASWLTPIVGGAIDIYGAINAADASKDAANIQSQSADKALAQNERFYNIGRDDLEPYRTAGVKGVNTLDQFLYGADGQQGSNQYGPLLTNFDNEQFEKEPGYQFRLAEGNKGIDRASSSRGSFDSGATLKALTRFNQDYASNEYGKAYNRDASNKDRTYNYLSGVVGTGQASAARSANLAQGVANQNSQLITGAGNARAAGTVGAANAWQSGLGNISGGIRDYNTINMMSDLYKNRYV